MKSGHPEEAASQGELLVLVGGASIELKALLGRLESRGVVSLPLGDGLGSDANTPSPRLVICDLASDGALTAAERFYARTPDLPGPPLVAIGNPRGVLSETQTTLLARAIQRYRRPLDVQAIAEELRVLLRQPRASVNAPSQRELTLPPLKPRSSNNPRIAPGPRESSPPSTPSSRPNAPAQEELVAPPSRQLGGPNAEHSVVSPELETLLAEAERRVRSQISTQGEAVASTPPEVVTAHLSDDVWDALGEALEDDADNPLPEALSDPVPPPSPLALDPAPPSLPPAPHGDSTIPPGRWQDPVNDDTGAFAPIPDSEPTSHSNHPVTAAGKSGAPATLAPGAARGTSPDAADEIDSEDLSVVDSPSRRIPTQPPGPPSTAAPGRRRGVELRQATLPALLTPRSAPPSSAPPASQSKSSERARADATSDHRYSPEPPAVEERWEAERDEGSRGTRRSEASEEMPAPQLDLPGALVKGGAPLVIGRAVRQRFTGCLAFEVDQGLRRMVFKDGDVVIAASAVHGESLVAFLAQRGDLSAEAATQIEHRIPTFGRHAGAALIARGLLEQGDLWPVLRAHSEWVLAQLAAIERGTVQIEHPVPERLAAEPSVFGGATGAEVLVEVVARAIPPAQAFDYLGSGSSTFAPGAGSALLGECALPEELARLVERAQKASLEVVLSEADDQPIFPCVLYALCLLEVLRKVEAEPTPAVRSRRLRAAAVPDRLDDEAVRARIQARRALVDEGDYFALLGVPRQATGYDIRRSYIELRRQFEPSQVLRPHTLDLADDVDTILEVLDEAYEILRDQQRRERYRRAIESLP